ncbi:hypothetical protein LSUE1_G009295, partial [Lachnellula suecica]
MVLLTTTASMVESLEKVQIPEPREEKGGDVHKEDKIESSNDTNEIPSEDESTVAIGQAEDKGQEEEDKALNAPVVERTNPTSDEKEGGNSTEPSLNDPKVGNPISHGQVIDLSRQLKSRGLSPCTLEALLKGARVYIPPPPPKKEPTSEYKALMARLRREEELRAYDRMTNPPPPAETFAQHFPASSAAHAFSKAHPLPASEEDDIVYADIDRQMALILNVIVSMVACAGAIWVVARWRSTPVRLALSMSGSALV